MLVLILAMVMLPTMNEEDYYGKYSSNGDFSIVFNLNEGGVEELNIQGKLIETVDSYDFLGYFGSTLLLEIKFSLEGQKPTTKILLDVEEQKFKCGTGFVRIGDKRYTFELTQVESY